MEKFDTNHINMNENFNSVPAKDGMLASLKSALLSHLSYSQTAKDIVILRVFHICSAFLIIALYYIYNHIYPNAYDSILVRLTLASASTLIVLLSFFNTYIRSHFLQVSYIMIFVYSIWIFFMLYSNNFTSQFVVIYFTLMVGISLTIREKKQLTLYSITSIVLYFTIIMTNPSPRVNPYSSVTILLAIQAFVYVIQWEKLRYKLILNDKNKELKEKNEEILGSINYAWYLQEAVLPQVCEINSYLPNSFIYYKPKDIVSGDFFWVDKKGDNIVVVAADCTGHGVPGALMSMIGSTALNEEILKKNIIKPSEILDGLNEFLYRTMSHKEVETTDIKDGMDISVCTINLPDKKLQFASAINPLYFVRNRELMVIKGDRMSASPATYQKGLLFTNHEINLKEGDSFYIFSDGYADQFGGLRGKKFRYKSFKQLLLSIQNKSMQEQCIAIDTVFKKWKGNYDQVDDVCVIGINI